MKCMVAWKCGSVSTHPLRELGAGAAEHVVVVGAVGVVARRHQLAVEAVGAAGEVLDDVGDLLAGEQVVDA